MGIGIWIGYGLTGGLALLMAVISKNQQLAFKILGEDTQTGWVILIIIGVLFYSITAIADFINSSDSEALDESFQIWIMFACLLFILPTGALFLYLSEAILYQVIGYIFCGIGALMGLVGYIRMIQLSNVRAATAMIPVFILASILAVLILYMIFGDKEDS